MFCQNCGRELKDEDKFCPACGTPATVSTEKETVEIPVEEQTFQEVPADEMERAAEENSERFEKREPVYYATPQQRYKKNTGILAGIILAIGRIVGETAALIFTAGTVPDIAKNLMSSGRTLAVHMYVLSGEGLHTDQAYATAVVLLVVVIIINGLSTLIAKKFTKA